MKLPFSTQEYEMRLHGIREAMSQRGLDALILTRPQNIYYASGYRAAIVAHMVSPFHSLVIPAIGEPRLITRTLERETVKEQWTREPQLYMDHEDPFKLLAEVLQEGKVESGKLGIEEGSLTVRQLNRMKQALPNAEFKEAAGTVEGIRNAPSEAEADYMRKAGKIASVGFQRAIELLKEGAYPHEVIGKVHDAMYEAGQTDAIIPVIVITPGPKGGRMHDISITDRINRGDLVTIEIFGTYNQYQVAAQGTIYVGDSPPVEVVDTYKLVSAMYKEARKIIEPGIAAGDIYDAANKVYRPVRGEDYYRRVGGSVGLTQFDISLGKAVQTPLRPGVSLLVQPQVDSPVLITCSATIMVTETGSEELTNPLLELKMV